LKTTAMQQSAEPDIYNKECPSRHLISRIGDKWSVMIIGVLEEETTRFGELKRRCSGISQKMLTQTLRNLENDGLVKRIEYDERVLRVEYSLTPLGQDLADVLAPLVEWVHQNYKSTLKGQEAKNV